MDGWREGRSIARLGGYTTVYTVFLITLVGHEGIEFIIHNCLCDAKWLNIIKEALRLY